MTGPPSAALSPLGLAALRLTAEYGWPVFPCEPHGKKPLTAHGLKDAAQHPEAVATWWDRWPDANIGIACGPAQLVVLDADDASALRQLGRLSLPETVSARTARGEHHYFAAPPGVAIPCSAGRLAPGLDVRAEGGYVVAPPSVHPSGAAYRWLRSPAEHALSALPDDLVRRLLSRASVPLPSAPRQSAPRALAAPDGTGSASVVRRIAAYLDRIGTVPEGTRNATAYRLAAFLVHDVGLSAGTARAVLESWNAERCIPPLGARELGAVLRSALKAGARAA